MKSFDDSVCDMICAFFIVVKELSEEQKEMIILSEEFQKFVIKAGRIVERALTESVDIYTDYIGGGDTDDNT